MKDEDIEKLVNLIRKFRDYFTSPESKKSAPKVDTLSKNVPAYTWEEWADVKENLPKKVSEDDIRIFVNGSAKNGFVLTTQGIHIHNIAGDPIL